jgi:hypothetical protein
LFKSIYVILVLIVFVNADDSARKKMKINLSERSYAPLFDAEQYSFYKGKAIFLSSVESEDVEEYWSDDKKVKYEVDDLEDYFENWINVAFDHVGLLIQEPPSYWQRAFQPAISVTINQSVGMAPKGMIDFRVNVTQFSETNCKIVIEGYIDGRISFKETIPVVFSIPPVTSGKEFLITNAFKNLDIMAAAILNNAKFHETIEKTSE